MAYPMDGLEVYINVLIVGAGPSGLMAASTLSRYGVDFRIIDCRPSGLQLGRAHCLCRICPRSPRDTEL